jgi:holo-[acyl-carrier protein] synthase
VARTPRLRTRLFADSEQSGSLPSLAGRFAAKEALIKAIGNSNGFRWRDIEITHDPQGKPFFRVHGRVFAVLERRGPRRLHVSISHDAGVACAFVIIESDPA